MRVFPSSMDLDAFVLDYFPAIYRQFSGSMQTTEKITLLLTAQSDHSVILEKIRQSGVTPATTLSLRGERQTPTSIRRALGLVLGFALLVSVGVALFWWQVRRDQVVVPAKVEVPTASTKPSAQSKPGPAPSSGEPPTPTSIHIHRGRNSGNTIVNSPGTRIGN